MTTQLKSSLRSISDIERFERELPLSARLPGDSVYDVFAAAAKQHGERRALTMVMTGEPDEQARFVTYRQLSATVCRAANLFASLGGPGCGVAYMLPTLIETHAVLWGAETAGYAVPINFLLQPEHIRALLDASGAKVLVTFGPHPQLDVWQKALVLQREIPGLKLVRVAPPGTPPVEGVIDFAAALAEQPDDRLVFGSPRRAADVAAYFHTGGTTGVPKLAAHTHSGQLTAALGAAALSDFRPDDVITGTLPMFHVGGTILLGLSAFMAGAEIVLLSPSGTRNPRMVSEFWRLCARYSVTLAGGVPTSLGAIGNVPLADADISKLRGILTGAASLPVTVRESLERATRHTVKEVYGMTECSGMTAMNPLGVEGGKGSVGFRFPYTKVTVRRLTAEGGLAERCDVGEIGVITVEGPHVSPGYKLSEQNEGVFCDGVLNSGDLGYTDEEGRLYIAGRSKDLIIRSGHNVDPLMIENPMQQHPAVAVAAAIGMPDSYAGELPVCYVQLHAGAEVTEEELREHAQATISERPAWPKHIYVVDNMPMTAVGKIYKPTLRQDATHKVVERVLDGLGVKGATIAVSSGGPRGMRVTVAVPNDSETASTLQGELSRFLFETVVTTR